MIYPTLLYNLKILALLSSFVVVLISLNVVSTLVIRSDDRSAYKPNTEEQLFLDDLKLRTFNFFWDTADPITWQSDDRFPNKTFTSIAATGFALPAYIIGVENNYISREEGTNRVLAVLEWLEQSKQGATEFGTTGYKGFYYHFLTYGDGVRYKDVELSTIDSALLFGGIIAAMEYFDGQSPEEARIRALSEKLFERVDWQWAMNNAKTMSMGWKPESGFIKSTWTGYNEAMLLLVLAMGSPTYPLDDNAWQDWTETYEWDEFYGYEHVNFGPLFGHQYSQMFIDFRGIQDEYMQAKNLDYFQNSRLATLANRAYCIDNPNNFKGYSAQIWGLTACDGPFNGIKEIDGKDVHFQTYSARGAASDYLVDDGTIAPTAVGGSIPFAPEYCIPTLLAMKNIYGVKLYQKYGFLDSFNPTWQPSTWVAEDYLGIDQGALLIQLENYHSSLIWDLMKKNKYVLSGLKRAGFNGGWLNENQ
jgi:hypothetical protein